MSLLGILPRPPFSAAGLNAIIAGRAVRLATTSLPADRWGRIQAHVMVHDLMPGTGGWLQARLVGAGQALAYAPPGLQHCQKELIATEAEARRDARGLWATDVTILRSSDANDALVGDEGTFRIVEGRVQRVSRSGGRVYLNFGRNWKKDFTAMIPAEVARAWPQPQPDFQSLRNATVRVRGWVKNRNGPLIVIEGPAMLDAPSLERARNKATRAVPDSHPANTVP